MGDRALAVLILLFALLCAFPAGAGSKDAAALSYCTQLCDDLSEREMQALDLTSIEQLAGSGAAVIRVTTEGTSRNSLAVDITRYSAAHSVVVIRSLRQGGALPRLVERTVDLPEARWKEIASRAREAVVFSKQVRSRARKPGSWCSDYSSAVSVVRDGKILVARACSDEDGIRNFIAWLSKQVAAWLPGCERLAYRGDGAGGILDKCLMLEGDRALAAEMANLILEKDFADSEYSFAASEPQRRFAFTDDCWIHWSSLDEEVNGGPACQKTLDEHGHPDLEFDGFYGLRTREDKRVEVWATGTALYMGDARADNGETIQVLVGLSAPFSISWRRGDDGQWRIFLWEIGAFFASAPDD